MVEKSNYLVCCRVETCKSPYADDRALENRVYRLSDALSPWLSTFFPFPVLHFFSVQDHTSSWRFTLHRTLSDLYRRFSGRYRGGGVQQSCSSYLYWCVCSWRWCLVIGRPPKKRDVLTPRRCNASNVVTLGRDRDDLMEFYGTSITINHSAHLNSGCTRTRGSKRQ